MGRKLVEEWDFIVMFYSDLMGLLIEICRGVSVSCSSSVQSRSSGLFEAKH